MTRILYTAAAAAALALAAPAMALTPVEKAVQHFNESNSGNDIIVLNPGSGITKDAAQIHAQTAANSNQGNASNDVTAEQLLDDNSIVNAQAAVIFKRLSEEEGAGTVN